MMPDAPVIPGLVVAESHPPVLERRVWYVIVAFWSRGRWWKVMPGEWLTADEAQREITRLPAGYTLAQIVEIPGYRAEMKGADDAAH